MDSLTYIFFDGRLSIEKLRNLIKNKGINLDNSVFVLRDSSNLNQIKDICSTYLLFDDYSKKVNFDKVRKGVLDLIKNFPHLKIYKGKSFVELLEYEGYSLWWFIRQGFFSHCIQVIKETIIIKEIIGSYKIKNIVLVSNDSEFIAIVKESIKNSSIKLKHLIDITSKRHINLCFKDILPRIIRTTQGLIRSSSVKNTSYGKNILLVTQAHVWTNLTNIRGDANSYTLLREILKDDSFHPFPLDFAINTEAAWKGIKEKKAPFIPFDYFIFSSFLNWKIRKRINKFKKRLKELLRNIEEKSNLKKILNYEGINLFEILRSRIRGYYLNNFDSLLGAARNFEMGMSILKKYNINKLICVDENGTSRFLVFAADKLSIKSVALQHGIIYPNHVSYSYSKNDLFNHKSKLNCILPTKTAVFGMHFKKLLINSGNYPSKSLVVTGHPRTDLLFENKKHYNKQNLFNKFGISPKDKLIIFPSTPLKDSSELKAALSAIIRCMRKLNDVKMIIKLHPGDKEIIYKNILRELNYDCVVVKEVDLYHLLYCSDLVISINSTVMLEALIMNKPVIQINLIEKYDFFGELKNKLIPQITDEKKLYREVCNSLFDCNYQKKLNNQRKKFVHTHYHKIDGKCTNRFLDIIK